MVVNNDGYDDNEKKKRRERERERERESIVPRIEQQRVSFEMCPPP